MGEMNPMQDMNLNMENGQQVNVRDLYTLVSSGRLSGLGITAEIADRVADEFWYAPSPSGPDNSASLNAAIKLTKPGGILQLKEGTYRIANPLVVDKPITLRGAGKNLTTIQVATPRAIRAMASNVNVEGIKWDGDNNIRRLFVDSITVPEMQNRRGWIINDCDLRGININASRIGGILPDGTSTTVGADLDSITVTNTVVREYQGQFGIELQGLNGAYIAGNWIHHIGTSDNLNGEGIKVDYECRGARIIGNLIEYNMRDGIDVYNGLEATIVGNVLRNNAQWGVEAKWGYTDGSSRNFKVIISSNLIYDNATGINGSIDNLIINGNRMWGQATTNISCWGSMHDEQNTYNKNINIANNVITGGSYGIDLTGAIKNSNVSGNIVSGATVDGIALQSNTRDCVITGNSSYDNGNRGIRINGSGHRVGVNKTQDVGDVYFTPGITGVKYASMVDFTG